MRILAVSDKIHPALYDYLDRDRFGHIDALISCGDLPDYYLDVLASTFNCPAFYVRGNHDPDANPPGWTNLDGKIAKVGNLRLMGFEGCRRYSPRHRVQYTEWEMWVKVLKMMPRLKLGGGVDILVTHAPPRGLHDATDLAHIGFNSFRWFLERQAPRYFLHGHQHLEYDPFAERVTQVGDTTLINAFGYHILEV